MAAVENLATDRPNNVSITVMLATAWQGFAYRSCQGTISSHTQGAPTCQGCGHHNSKLKLKQDLCLVGALCNLSWTPSLMPHAHSLRQVKLLGMNFAVWKDANGAWSCLQDKCSHRYAAWQRALLQSLLAGPNLGTGEAGQGRLISSVCHLALVPFPSYICQDGTTQRGAHRGRTPQLLLPRLAV